MATTVAEMTIEELHQMIETIVETVIDRKFAKLRGAFEDDGDIRPEVRQQLLQQLRAVAEGERGQISHIRSPRLYYPEQASDFRKEIFEE